MHYKKRLSIKECFLFLSIHVLFFLREIVFVFDIQRDS